MVSRYHEHMVDPVVHSCCSFSVVQQSLIEFCVPGTSCHLCVCVFDLHSDTFLDLVGLAPRGHQECVLNPLHRYIVRELQGHWPLLFGTQHLCLTFLRARYTLQATTFSKLHRTWWLQCIDNQEHGGDGIDSKDTHSKECYARKKPQKIVIVESKQEPQTTTTLISI